MILDIFAQRARSFEGKLQVELAQLSHLATRLVRGWTHLERQKGGIGLRGPGETQLETDRRLIAKRIRTLKARLEKLARQRDTGRHVRREVPVPTVALVGYTNAGKSTLFNALTGSDDLRGRPAVRDPGSRPCGGSKLAGVGEVVLADTVGFVRALPHELVAAFRSTLQEARDADLLLHVVDASDPLRDERIEQVREVLARHRRGRDPRTHGVQQDRFGERRDAASRAGSDGIASQAWVSAVGGRGLAGVARGHGAGGAAQSGAPHAAPGLCSAAAVARICTGAMPCAPSGSARTAAGSSTVELDSTEVAKLLGGKGVDLVGQ